MHRITKKRLSERVDSTRRRIRPSRVQALISIGLVTVLLGLIAFSVYQVARHVTTGLSTLRTQEIVDESYVSLDLYLIRHEAVLYAEGSAVTHYAVRDGEKVGVGTRLGTAYATNGTAAEDAALQKTLNAYSERIALLQELDGLGTPADARAEAEAVDRYYLGLLNAAEDGDLSAVGGFADRMQEGIGRYDILTGNADGAGTVSALKAEEAALLAELSPVATLRTDQGGYFYYTVDGYESAFPYADVLSMTPAEFRAMTDQPAAAVPPGVVGKMVYDSLWYAAATVAADDPAVELFRRGLRDGQSYRMQCGDSAGTTVTMQVERMEADDEGVLIVFSSREMPDGFAFSRTFRATCVADSVSGYRIPTEALVTLRAEATGEEVTGVYILAGNVVEFRKVRIRASRNGYVIADTYEEVQALLDTLTEEERAEATADGYIFLRFNDNILVSGNELYEGKMIG